MYLLFDIGGTNTRLTISKDRKTFGEIQTIPTSMNFQEAMSSFKKASLKLIKKGEITLAVGGVRALDMRTKTKLVHNPNFPMWVDEPLKKSLEKVLGTAVYLENDAAMAGLGEAVFGAGKGKRIVAYMTISTGIGGARIIDGKIDESVLGFEPGNQIIDVDASLKPAVAKPGYFERYVSGHALEKRYGRKPEDLKDPVIWEEVAKLIAIGLNNTIVHWSPDIVVLGGSVTRSFSLDRLVFHLHEVLKIFPQPPEIVKASLGDVRGLYGALAYAKTKR